MPQWRKLGHAIAVAASALVMAEGRAQESGADVPVPKAWHGRVELKRENTARGTPEESTKTLVRLETFLDGAVEMLRLDLPFPDAKTDFEGDPFEPRRGDVKIRARFSPLKMTGYSMSSFVEATFPTAYQSLGGGKYQLSAAARALVPVELPVARPKEHQARLEAELQQVNSVAGDADRADINHTKLEFTFNDVLRGKYGFKLKFKPTVDWTQNGKTGSVGEIEGGMFFARNWRTWLMLGHRLTGPDSIRGTYETRLEIGIARTY